MHRRHTTPATMSERFFDHGLGGIDLHHAETQRTLERDLSGSLVSPVSAFRQTIAALFIAAGTWLAGEDVRPSTSNQFPARPMTT